LLWNVVNADYNAEQALRNSREFDVIALQEYGVITSLLQLDIKGAFDTINYIRLLDTLR
jgi:hypothetical protein